MIINCFLVVDRRGGTRLTKNHPRLDSDEIAMAINLDIPKKFFDRPFPSVTIEIPEEAIPDLSQAMVVRLAVEAASESLGLSVDEVIDGLAESARKDSNDE